MTEQPSNCWFS